MKQYNFDIIKQHEGFASKKPDLLAKFTPKELNILPKDTIVYPYRCSAGKLTIGYGCRIDNTSLELTQYQNGCTILECENLFLQKMTDFVNCIENETIGIMLNDKQKESLISLCFNIGIKAFKNSTLLKVIKRDSKDFYNIKNEWLKWSNINGKQSIGLLKRRENEYFEYALFQKI